MKLPNKLYLSPDDWDDINDEFEYDFSKIPDATGSTQIHRKYILKDDSEFVPEEWGWEAKGSNRWELGNWGLSYGCKAMQFHPKRVRAYNLTYSYKRGSWVVYYGLLTPTLYRLIAQANNIPLPDHKK